MQRYEHGIPVSDLVPVDGDGATGTTVSFMPEASMRVAGLGWACQAGVLMSWSSLVVEVIDDGHR